MRNVPTYLLFVCLLVIGHRYHAQFQTESERKDYANNLFEQKKFVEAEPHMLYFLSQENSSDYSYKYGVCALNTFADKSKAIRFLSFAVKDKNVNPEVFFYLGKAYHLNYLFNDAIKNFEIFKNKSTPKIQKEFQVDMHISMCKSGKTLMQNLTDLVVKDKISSSYDKFQYSYDFSSIGGRILVYDGFQSKLDKKLDYRSVMYFPEDKDLVFFSSYGKDGSNGLDIFLVRRLQDGWSEPEILPAHINTPFDDAFAFLHSDGRTFYFCSKGHSSMGGYDIFRSIYDKQTNSFGPPSNMDYKINTPDDDIMYVVDSSNNNAFFSSSRASKAGFIDVYNVNVEVFPIQNVIIAGDFENQIDPTDYDAEIQVIDIVTDEVVGIFHPNKEKKYTVILPKSGKYKFVVETPNSQSIHTGLVEVMPQKELSLLKQEIALVDNNGTEQLLIRNLFDQKVENESEILAEVMLELSNPKINFDEFTDDLFLEELSIEESVAQSQPVELEENIDLIALSNELSLEAQEEADEIETKMNASFMVAETKRVASQNAAKQAQEILSNIEEINNPIEKQQQADLAKEYHNKSKELNQQAISALNIANSLKSQFEIKSKEAQESKEIAASIEKAIKGDSHSEALEQLGELQQKINKIIEQDPVVEGSKEDKQQEIVALNKKANVHLKNAQEIRKEQESIQISLDNAKRELSSTKKKKDRQDIEERIVRFEKELELTDQMAKEEFEKHEKLISQTKNLNAEVKMLDEVSELVETNTPIQFSDQEKKQLQDQVLSAEQTTSIDDNEILLAELSNQITENISTPVQENNHSQPLIDINDSDSKESEDVSTITADLANNETSLDESSPNPIIDDQPKELKDIETEIDQNSETNTPSYKVEPQLTLNEKSELIESNSQEIFAEKQQQAFEEVTGDLENSESSMYDYSDSFNETISFNSLSSSEKAQEIEDDQEMLMVAKQELNSLELENLVEEKESRKIARQEEIQQKKLAISEMETQLSSSFQKVVDSEKNTNDSIFNSIESVLTPELLLEEDFLSAKYYNDQAQQQYERASALKQQAALINDVEQKAELLKEAHQNELAAMENQQDALNLLDEVDVPNPELANNSSITNSNLIESRAEENRATNSDIEGDNLAQNPLYNSNQSSAQTLNFSEENSNEIAKNNPISPNETNGSEETEQQIDANTPSTSEFSESETNSEVGVFTTQVDGQITDVESSPQVASNLNNSSNEQSSSGTTQNLENDQEIPEDVALNETFNEGSDKTSNDSNISTNTTEFSEDEDASVLSSTNPAEN
ncbi:MAG: hypothetical protein VXY47_06495, partial [Bacteroidota bacterium]|nr:hypothetical protein [Bacteroidota bacterium]